MAPHTPGVLRFGKLFEKTPVAPAGYKNKQCREQSSQYNSVPKGRSCGRIVTAYVPLRSATGAHRTKVRACRVSSYLAKGYGDYFTNFQVNKLITKVSCQNSFIVFS